MAACVVMRPAELGSGDLPGLPTALLTLGSAPAAFVTGRAAQRVGLPLTMKPGARPALGGVRLDSPAGPGRHRRQSHRQLRAVVDIVASGRLSCPAWSRVADG